MTKEEVKSMLENVFGERITADGVFLNRDGAELSGDLDGETVRYFVTQVMDGDEENEVGDPYEFVIDLSNERVSYEHMEEHMKVYPMDDLKNEITWDDDWRELVEFGRNYRDFDVQADYFVDAQSGYESYNSAREVFEEFLCDEDECDYLSRVWGWARKTDRLPFSDLDVVAAIMADMTQDGWTFKPSVNGAGWLYAERKSEDGATFGNDIELVSIMDIDLFETVREYAADKW